MAKFRKKPVTIDAWQVPPPDDTTREAPPAWIVNAIVAEKIRPIAEGGAIIETLEGDMRANVGDWIIRGVKAELYPCKPDIFAATYDPL